MEEFEEAFISTLNNMGGSLGAYEGKEFVENVQKVIDAGHAALKERFEQRINVPGEYVKGDLAEQWHAGTLKIDAAVQEKENVWAEALCDNITGQDIRYGDSSSSYLAELKYYKTGEDTAKAISRPEYDASEKIVPSDQKQSVIESAQRLAKRNEMNRPEQAEHYQDTASRADDRLRVGNVESKPLSEKDAKEMMQDLRNHGDIDPDKYGLNTESFITWSEIVKKAEDAGLHAFVFSAALTAAPCIWQILEEYISRGEINVNDLMVKGQTVFFSASKAGFKGGVAAGLTVALNSGLLGESFKNAPPLAVGMATTLALNAIAYSIRLHQGVITQREFAHYCLRDSFALIGGYQGAAIGQTLIPIPLFGALVGNLLGATLGAIVFEGMDTFFLKACVESGWTFWGIVKQEYGIPKEILQEAGYKIFTAKKFNRRIFEKKQFVKHDFYRHTLSIKPLRRGLITCNVIGYI